MKFLKILERAWLFASVAALVLAAYNFIVNRAFNHQVYFPIFCAVFCVLIYRNIKSQRQFREQQQNEQKNKASDAPDALQP